MSTKNLLDGVEDTLYIPLAARIYASEKFPKFFYDEKALSLKQPNIFIWLVFADNKQSIKR